MSRLNIGLGFALGISSILYLASINAFPSIADASSKCPKEALGLKLCRDANGKHAYCEDAEFDLSACIMNKS